MFLASEKLGTIYDHKASWDGFEGSIYVNTQVLSSHLLLILIYYYYYYIIIL